MDKLDFDINGFIKDDKIISSHHQCSTLDISILYKLKQVCLAVEKINRTIVFLREKMLILSQDVGILNGNLWEVPNLQKEVEELKNPQSEKWLCDCGGEIKPTGGILTCIPQIICFVCVKCKKSYQIKEKGLKECED